MKQKDKLIIKKVIEARIAELQNLLLETHESALQESVELGDEDTRLDTLAGLTVDTALFNKARHELSSLQTQLSHVDDEEFGNCEVCGSEITPARLAMVPTTRLCIHCAQQQENP